MATSVANISIKLISKQHHQSHIVITHRWSNELVHTQGWSVIANNLMSLCSTRFKTHNMPIRMCLISLRTRMDRIARLFSNLTKWMQRIGFWFSLLCVYISTLANTSWFLNRKKKFSCFCTERKWHHSRLNTKCPEAHWLATLGGNHVAR